MSRLLPESLAEVLINATDALQIQEFDKLCLRSTKIRKRKPADYAFMLDTHYSKDQFASFAQPYSKVDKEGKMTDFRGRKIENTNQLPIFDTWWSIPHGSDKPIRHSWYIRFVNRLPVGKDLADKLKLFQTVKTAQSGTTAGDAIDLANMDTKVTFETSRIGADGEPTMVTMDIRDMTAGDVADYVKDCNRQTNDMANAYRDGVVLLQQRNEINSRPELKGKVEIDWNYVDPSDKTTALHGNGLPFVLYAMVEREEDTAHGKVKFMTRGAFTPITWEKLYDMDIDKACAAISAPDSKVTPYRALLDNKYKKQEDRTAAGQGETEDKKRVSKIPAAGANSMRDVLPQLVYFFENEGTMSAFKNYVFNGVAKDERDPVWHNLVSLQRLLNAEVTDDMKAAYNRVEEQDRLRAKQEKEQKEAAEAAASQPSQRELQARAQQEEADRVMKAMTATPPVTPPITPEPESVRVQPAAPTAAEIKPASSRGSAKGSAKGRAAG